MEDLKSAQGWQLQLDLAKKDAQKWRERGKKIVQRYRDERGQTFGIDEKKYNILWSNIRTLLPAVYAKKPSAIAERRYKDQDPVGRTASEILQRCLQYEIDTCSDYDSGIKNSVLDRLLPGRGVAWVRFEQAESLEVQEEPQISDDVEREYQYEKSPVDYVYWEDFRHSPARTWEEVTWVARRVYLSLEEGIERFGEEFEKVPLVHQPIGLDEDKMPSDIQGEAEKLKKARVWEIWDKSSKSAIWVAEQYPYLLDERPDPLELDEFFPCPKPLFATLSTDTLIPIPDYAQYQDQAQELDSLTDRIFKLTKACKVVGVYDASQVGVQRMLTEGVDNTLIPVDTWAAFGEKGGIKGVVDWLPLDMIVATLNELYAAREQVKQVIYEVTGLSDIIRGASNAAETATAQQIKSNYASLRLKEMQNEVAVFASDLLRIKAQIMCKFYKPDTLVMMSGMQASKDAQYIPQAIQLLQSDVRNFRVEVASDSLVQMDEQEEKASRLEFLGAASQFLKEAVPAAQQVPELAPVLGEMLLFGIRSFKAGRNLEGSFEAMLQALQNKPPAEPQTDPEMIKIQQQGQIEQARLQLEQQKAQLEQQKAQIEVQAKAQESQLKAQLEQAKIEAEAQKSQLEAQKLEFERWKAELESNTKVVVAELQAKTSLKQASISANASQDREGLTELDDEGNEQPTSALSGLVEAINQNMMQLLTAQDEKNAQLIEAINRPKTVLRGPDGKVLGVQ